MGHARYKQDQILKTYGLPREVWEKILLDAVVDNMLSENRNLVRQIARLGSVCTLFGSITRTSTFRKRAQELLYERGE